MTRKTVTIAIISESDKVTTLTLEVDINEIQNDDKYPEDTPIGDYLATGKMIKRFSPKSTDSPYIEGHIVKEKPGYNEKWHKAQLLIKFIESDEDGKDDTHE